MQGADASAGADAAWRIFEGGNEQIKLRYIQLEALD